MTDIKLLLIVALGHHFVFGNGDFVWINNQQGINNKFKSNMFSPPPFQCFVKQEKLPCIEVTVSRETLMVTNSLLLVVVDQEHWVMLMVIQTSCNAQEQSGHLRDG